MAAGKFNDKQRAVARVYAEAMLSLAAGSGAADSLREEFDAVAGMTRANPGFADFLANPVIDADERQVSLERMFRGKLSDLAVDSIQVLNRKGRSALLPAVAAEYRRAHDRHQRRIEVQVTSAKPLTDDQRGRLAAAIEKRTGFAPTFDENVDPSLLGGLVVRIGDEKTDGSAVTRLHNLTEALSARASREIHSGTYVEGT
ncbi:MAG TPA: ATP synthase F1 subunit delta [Thermoanaerobaculia bacterium]|nr:ATP synthase F1 subunit delta [Thermoanaerobaculia bacterium]